MNYETALSMTDPNKWHANEPLLVSFGVLQGSCVVDREGEDVGEIVEVMIDLDLGCIALVMLSFEGYPDLEDLRFFLPWPLLNADVEEGVFRLRLDLQELDKAHGFRRHEGPRMLRRSYADDLYARYGCTPPWKDKPASE